MVNVDHSMYLKLLYSTQNIVADHKGTLRNATSKNKWNDVKSVFLKSEDYGIKNYSKLLPIVGSQSKIDGSCIENL